MNPHDSEEHIRIGADVISSAGDKVGSVAYVVVHPPEMHVTDIVVSTGAILGRDVLVAVDKVNRIADGQIHLSIDKDQLEKCEDYVEVEYEGPPPEWAPATGWGYPAGGTLWPTGSFYPEVSSVHVNAPSGTVGIRHGMDVESSDGHKVGSIDALDANLSTDDLTEMVVKQGHLFTHDIHIPIGDVDRVDEEKVVLKLSRDEVRQRFGQRQ